jgi:hypothetical protein
MGKGQEFWIGERVERLSTLWAEGKSDSKIAAILSTEWQQSVSRCAIIGARHRHLSKDNRKSTINGVTVMTRPKKPTCSAGAKRKHELSKTSGLAQRGQRYVAPGRLVLRPKVPPIGNLRGPQSSFSLDVPGMEYKRVGLLELTDSVCRWPLDDLPHQSEAKVGGYYCGNARAEDHKSYCSYHAALATRRY